MRKALSNILTVLFVLISTFSFSQGQESGLEKTFHESGKIYVVVAVIGVIFIGIIYYLIRLDRKINKLEDEISNK